MLHVLLMFYSWNRNKETAMPDRRGHKGSVDDLLPKDLIPWARDIWADREEVAKSDNGPWMLREAPKALGLAEETADELLRRQTGTNSFRY
jgi:hypothetical protein